MFQNSNRKAGKKEYDLAATLHEQQKYDEAEQLLRQSVQQQEKVLGTTHEDTLRSRYRLAVTIHRQQKYNEAEQLFRQSVQQREKVLSTTHEDTLWSRYWLAVTLYTEQKYDEAEQLLRQLVQQREKVLGTTHKDTLWSRYSLAVTLYTQQKYDEAEQLLQQSVQQQEKVLGTTHKDTLASKGLLQNVILARVPSATLSPLAEAARSRLGDFFTEGTERQTAYNDSEIQQVSRLLSQINTQWSKVPRTYITLRTISCLDLLNAFINLGFSDHWFPVTESGLPHCLRPSQRVQFVAAQSLVMTKSLDLEKGDKGRHCNFHPDESLPFEEKGILGTGGFGQVDRILSLISFQEYARKRVPRSMIFGGRRTEDIKRFIAEIEVLKRLKHRHVAEFVGSYTDPKYMGLIMSPVAEMDLSTYLARANAASHKELRTFFGCLARALEFLHGEKVRHKDIKPSNILVHHGNVLLTDFGLAFDFADASRSTTLGTVNGITPKYCAPEVADSESRNSSSDIWSLGVVFLEMAAVLKGKSVEFIDEFLLEHGSRRAFVRTNPSCLGELLANLKETSYPTDNVVLIWIQDMLMIQPTLRPTAAALIASITAAGESGNNRGLCGICCMSPDDHGLLDDYDMLDIT
ncbi:uncharacterized protein BP5553_07779 [Venustampulla echinocandica]|uniref:Protein kinase domain-containing protein n=1 Tax=Venustampulla echinocandica TaxID=2656787 RepID=A0A370THH2_9HELO|nr:uncharacterized protein BP5553_07779 [Venustampulla echinocandica]RDL34651.1 hypothetical protein BP5553_07779 [Venustampulla echinocandica]